LVKHDHGIEERVPIHNSVQTTNFTLILLFNFITSLEGTHHGRHEIKGKSEDKRLEALKQRSFKHVGSHHFDPNHDNYDKIQRLGIRSSLVSCDPGVLLGNCKILTFETFHLAKSEVLEHRSTLLIPTSACLLIFRVT
jgi:hypothetical protein